MRDVLVWYLVLQLLTLAGLPLSFAWLRRLPSRGFAVAKTLGVLLVGVVFWWGGIAQLWANTAAGAVVAALAVLGVGLWLMRNRWAELRPWWERNREFVLATEFLFALAFLLWVIVRALQPQLETAGGEKWMEIAFLNAVLRAPSMPPHDPWLSGYAISYYYLGYHLVGMITKLAAVPGAIAFNLGVASWFALTATGAYGVVYDLLGGEAPGRALFGPLLLVVTGNGQGFLEVLHARGLLPARFWAWLDIRNLSQPPQPPFSWRPTRYFWWWQASRTIRDYTPWGAEQEIIDEFPAFSFTLGDMHPHLLMLPVAMVLVTLALNLYHRAGEAESFPATRAQWERWVYRLWPLAGYAVVLGALGFLNTWDFPIYWALLMGAFVLGRARRAEASPLLDRLIEALPEAVALGVLSLAFYLPFWIGLRSQAGGILPNLFNATRLPQFAVMFAPLLIPVAGIVATAVRRTRLHWLQLLAWSMGALMGLLLVGIVLGLLVGYPHIMAVLRGQPVPGMEHIAPQTFAESFLIRLMNPWTALVLAMAVVGSVVALFRDDAAQRLPTFPLLLVLLGALLTLAPEFVFLKDVFYNRMNTVFKFYFQAWVLWSLAGSWWLGQTVADLRARRAHRVKPAALGLALLLIGVGLVYTVLAVPQRAREHGTPWTLDGMAWLRLQHPDDWEAIHWLNENVTGTPVIVEAPGANHGSYRYEGRVSALTGLPTVLGWAGHQRQWRGTYDEQAAREQALQRLFTTTSLEVVADILARYEVRYIYVGPVERALYTPAGLDKFAERYPVVFRNAGVVIYEVTP